MNADKKALRRIDAPHYGYLKAILLSFYSSKLYVDVLKRWKGFGLLYLLLIIIVFTIPFSIRLVIHFNQFFSREVIQPLRSIPPLRIENGRVKSEKPMPWIIEATQERKIVIDTRKNHSVFNPKENPEVRILITETSFHFFVPAYRLFFRPNQSLGQPLIVNETFSPVTNGVISGKELLEYSRIGAIRWLPILGFWPLVFSTMYALYLVVLLFFSMLGQLLSHVIFKYTISYKQACRLMAVAMTPQVLLLTFYITTQWFQGFISAISIALLSLYFSYGLLANRRESKKMVRA